ncbi:MAG: hypothetical protein AAF656_05360 [Planctomycetota bacterium]
MHRILLRVWVVAIVMGLGCEERDEELGWVDLTRPAVVGNTLETFTQLPSGAAVMSATGDGGLVFSVRGSGRDDEVYLVRAQGIPDGVGLTLESALAAVGVEDGSGHFTALHWTPRGLIYFFSGGNDRVTADHVGLLAPGSAGPRVLLGAGRLEEESGLGGTLVLVEPQLVGDGTSVTLLLRTPGDVGLVQFDVSAIPKAGGALPVRTLRLPVIGGFGPLTLRETDLLIAAGDRPSRLVVTDPAGVVYSADFSVPRADLLAELAGLPSPIPAAQASVDGHVVAFAPPTPWIDVRPGEEDVATMASVWFIGQSPKPTREFVTGRGFDVASFSPSTMTPIDETRFFLHDPESGVVGLLTVVPPEGSGSSGAGGE